MAAVQMTQHQKVSRQQPLKRSISVQEFPLRQILVQDPWFTEIKEGRKTVEGRGGYDGEFDDVIEGKIRLVGPNDETLDVIVKAVRHYVDLVEYIDSEGYEKIAPHTNSNDETYAAYHDVVIETKDKIIRVFSISRVREWGGINAIEIVLSS